MASFRNRILRVDLSNASFSEQLISDSDIHDYLGGRGFGVKLLYDYSPTACAAARRLPVR